MKTEDRKANNVNQTWKLIVAVSFNFVLGKQKFIEGKNDRLSIFNKHTKLITIKLKLKYEENVIRILNWIKPKYINIWRINCRHFKITFENKS